jgi:ubiquitin carboxyl-terminal hydrolase 8
MEQPSARRATTSAFGIRFQDGKRVGVLPVGADWNIAFLHARMQDKVQRKNIMLEFGGQLISVGPGWGARTIKEVGVGPNGLVRVVDIEVDELEIDQRTPNTISHVRKEGYLNKRATSRHLTNWRKRYFILDSERKNLRYFRLHSSTEKMRGVMVLNSGSVVVESQIKLNCFELNTSDATEAKCLTMQAASKQQCTEWMNAINQAIDAVAEEAKPASSDVDSKDPIAMEKMKQLQLDTTPIGLRPRSETRDFIIEGNVREKGGRVGLVNLGNTCYMASALQCLSHTTPLCEFFLADHHLKEINAENFLGSGGKLASCFCKLVRDLWKEDGRSPVKPSKFKKQLQTFAPQFSGYQQHDSQELMAFLLDGLHEDMNRVTKKPYVEDVEYLDNARQDEEVAVQAWKQYLMRDKSVIVDLFQGQLKSTIRCLECSCKRTKFDPFMYLSVPIESHVHQQAQRSGRRVSLMDCIRYFQEEERLDGDNQWYCPRCKEHRDAAKQIEIYKLPEILIVHFRRFSVNKHGRPGPKRTELINFPTSGLDLSSFCHMKEKPIYDLYAVSNHMGGLNGGHYNAYAMHRATAQWYLYDDSHVQRVDESDVCTSSGYVLFYEKRDAEAGGIMEGDGDDARVAMSPARPAQWRVKRQSVHAPHLWPHSQAAVSDLQSLDEEGE